MLVYQVRPVILSYSVTLHKMVYLQINNSYHHDNLYFFNFFISFFLMLFFLMLILIGVAPPTPSPQRNIFLFVCFYINTPFSLNNPSLAT